jgi:DNA-binding IclR family transcriptional regulator
LELTEREGFDVATPKNRSILKAFAILRAFRRPDESLTSAELSRRANLPEASGYRLVQTLEEIGAVVRGSRGRYRPGMLLVHLSKNVEVAELLRESSHAELRDLAAKRDLTVHMGVLEDGMVHYVAKVGRAKGYALHTRVGAQLEAYSSGLGKVLLAALPDEELDRFLDEGALIALTPHTITDKAQFRAELERVRACGFAIDDRETSLDLRCVAVPLRDASGRTIAAISVSDEPARMTEMRREEVRQALRQTASAISRKLCPDEYVQKDADRSSRAPRNEM